MREQKRQISEEEREQKVKISEMKQEQEEKSEEEEGWRREKTLLLAEAGARAHGLHQTEFEHFRVE